MLLVPLSDIQDRAPVLHPAEADAVVAQRRAEGFPSIPQIMGKLSFEDYRAANDARFARATETAQNIDTMCRLGRHKLGLPHG